MALSETHEFVFTPLPLLDSAVGTAFFRFLSIISFLIMMQRKGATINFSNSCCDTKQKQNRYIHLNIKHIYRFKKAHLIQGSYSKDSIRAIFLR